MDLQELSEKYRALQAENRQLKQRIKQLELQAEKKSVVTNDEVEISITNKNQTSKPDAPTKVIKTKIIDKQSAPTEKITLFQSLFKGREDVFATRWENSKKGISGYSPACGNEWIPGICQKPKINPHYSSRLLF